MSVISQTFSLIGQFGVTARRVQMVVTNLLSAVTTPGYLQFTGVNTNQVQTTEKATLVARSCTVTTN